jgi:DNA-binding winged helix-turn-helix (wHTH) protein/pimeloyl-ACP methyl ester carboxylesterase
LIYTFENYCLDLNRRELRRGTEAIPMEPRVFDLLEFLVRNQDRVVNKDELIAAVWNGRIVSDSAITSRINAARRAIGDSGKQQRLIRTIARKGHRFIGEVHPPAKTSHGSSMEPATRSCEADRPSVPPGKQTVTFCRTKDGFNLAVASVGRGPVLVRAAHWATNIEYDWQNPVTGPLLQRLVDRFRLVRYDGRGSGLSDRQVPSVSLSTLLDDLETVTDSFGLERFVLLGISGGAAASIAYAARHPHRVSKLVLYGGYAQGRNKRGSPQDVDEAKAFLTMVQSGWDNRSVFMRAFFSFWLPSGSPEQVKWFTDLQRVSLSRENTVKFRMAVDDIDIVDLLPNITVPTIVFHCLHDRLVPFDQGRRLATSIPNAKFVALESDNHVLLPDEPAWTKFVGEMEEFLAD